MIRISQLSALFSSTTLWIIAGVVMVSLILLCIFKKTARLIVGLVLAVALLFTGTCAIYYDIEYFTAQGAVYGTDVEGNHNETVVVFDGYTKFTYSAFGFESNGIPNEYVCKTKFENKTVDLSSFDGLKVNSTECETLSNDIDYIKATYKLNFYDDENIVMCSDDLYISVYSYTNFVEVELKTKGGDSAVKFWKRYLGKNNFVVKLANITDMPLNSTIELDETPQANLITFNISFDASCEVGRNITIRVVDMDNTRRSWSKTIKLTSDIISNGFDYSLSGLGNCRLQISPVLPARYSCTVNGNASLLRGLVLDNYSDVSVDICICGANTSDIGHFDI